MLIDKTFFEGLLLIPNTNEPDPNNRTGKDLDELIMICEEEVLSFAFGKKMYDDFVTHYKADTLPQEYKDILEGKEYTKDGKDYHWPGLVQTEPYKKSILAEYVYATYHTRNVTQQTEFGQAAADNKVGTKASSTPKITRSWNSFLYGLQGGTFMDGAHGLTPEGNPYWIIGRRLGGGYGVSYYGNNNGGEVSLLKFLDHNKDLYPLLDVSRKLTVLTYKNSFGI